MGRAGLELVLKFALGTLAASRGLITSGLEVCLASLCTWLNGKSCEKRPGLLIVFQPLWILVLIISLICTFGGSPGV